MGLDQITKNQINLELVNRDNSILFMICGDTCTYGWVNGWLGGWFDGCMGGLMGRLMSEVRSNH